MRSNVVAYIALFVALGGTAFAAVELQRNSVRSTHIVNGQVKRGDLARNAVNSSRVANGSLRAADFPAGELPAGPAGSPDTPAQVRDKLLQADGAGSGVDSDLVDGISSQRFHLTAAGGQTVTESGEIAPFRNEPATAELPIGAFKLFCRNAAEGPFITFTPAAGVGPVDMWADDGAVDGGNASPRSHVVVTSTEDVGFLRLLDRITLFLFSETRTATAEFLLDFGTDSCTYSIIASEFAD